MASEEPTRIDAPRRRKLLDAAVATFARFGYRKTSMEEVALAAQVSRQALYLHFATKEALFREAVRHGLATGFEAVSLVLRDASLSCEEKLAGAFDAWIGRYVGMVGADVTDLEEASNLLAKPLIEEGQERFIEMLTKTIRASNLPAAYKPAGLTARDLAEMLYATARGLKKRCASPAAFRDRFSVAVRAVCMPARQFD